MRDLRILLVDDHEVVRLGLKALLGRHPRFEVVGEAATADEAVAKARVHKPDMVSVPPAARTLPSIRSVSVIVPPAVVGSPVPI